jgi:hypothetical protein
VGSRPPVTLASNTENSCSDWIEISMWSNEMNYIFSILRIGWQLDILLFVCSLGILSFPLSHKITCALLYTTIPYKKCWIIDENGSVKDAEIKELKLDLFSTIYLW